MYDDRPALARVPLTSDDVEALLLTDGSQIAGDRRRVRHLLTRMRAAFAAHLETVRSMQRDVEHLQSRARTSADPVAEALSALAKCTVEQQRQVYDRRAQVLLDTVRAAQEEATAARVAAASETNRARLVLAELAARPDLPEQVRELLQRQLEQLPLIRHPAPAHVPPVDGGGFSVPPAEAPELRQ